MEEKKVIYVSMAEFRAKLKNYIEIIRTENTAICLKKGKTPVAIVTKFVKE